jgi:hypothetical protein
MGEQMFTTTSEVFSRQSVVSDDLVQSVDQKIGERLRFSTSELSCEFPQIVCTVLYEIIIVRLGYHKFGARWVLKMLTGAQKNSENCFSFDFFRAISKSRLWISQSCRMNNS